ncbi:MAG: sigma-54-dependent Fis family transcriptional regulator, partial [Planctomycetes bacterium]|nr:sigma-54-dependent Fis family transcriptional regulator [Planctomycetota bacterium]
GGTLFLDEVTEMPIELQVRLLRVLETNRITRVGGHSEVEVDVRLIAATNRDPKEAVERGVLRHDLLYRLLVFPVAMPPLKDREGDVRLLAQHFIEKLDEQHGERRTLSAAALRVLESHDWPGNVRELYNTLRRAYIMSTDEIRPGDLLLGEMAPLEQAGEASVAAADAGGAAPSSASNGAATPVAAASAAAPDREIRPGMSIAQVERRLIEATLAHVDGNKKEAVKLLGISLKTLYSRLQVYAAAGNG